MRQTLKSLFASRGALGERWVEALLGAEGMWDRLGIYPPFLFFGIGFVWSDDAHRLTVTVPLRWYFRNNSGVMFGAAMAVASDPFPALMLQRLVPGTLAWTRRHQIQYSRPAKGTVRFTVEISRDELSEIRGELERRGRVSREYEFWFHDDDGRRVAKVSSQAHLVRRT